MSNKKSTLMLLTALLLAGSFCSGAGVLHSEPELTIWSWDYPDDLRFLKKSDHIKVAYYAGTIHLRKGRCFFRPRTKSLKINPDIQKFPAIRIESDSEPVNCQNLAGLIRQILQKENNKIVQIDFDAKQEELPFYRELLRLLEAQPDKSTVNITALTSWYTTDQDILKTGKGQKTAMCFSLGKGARESLIALTKAKQKPDSIGVSVYEHQTNKLIKELGLTARARSIYFYSAIPWQQVTLQKAKAEVLCQ